MTQRTVQDRSQWVSAAATIGWVLLCLTLGHLDAALAASPIPQRADPPATSAESQAVAVFAQLADHEEGKALVSARIAIALFPDETATRAALGKALFRNGQYAEGLGMVSALSSADRDRYDLNRSIRAAELVLEGDTHTRNASGDRAAQELLRAATLYEEAASADSQNVTLRKTLGWMYLDKLNNTDRARVHLGAVFRTMPEDLNVQKLLAIANARSGRLREAIPIFRQILERDPVDRWMLINLARVLTATGELAEAEGIYQRLRLTDPDDLQAQLGLIEIMASQTRTAPAISAAQAMLAASPAPSVHTLLGDIYRWNWHLSSAKESYDAALSIDRSFGPAHEGQRELARLRAPTAEPKAFVFNDSDRFERSMTGVSSRMPLSQRAFVKVDVEQWWFRIAGDASTPRLDAGAELEYHWTQGFETRMAAVYRRSSEGTMTSSSINVKWSPSRDSTVYFTGAKEIPVADSIATIRSALSQNVAAGGLDLALNARLSTQFGASVAAYADGNQRRELMAQASWRLGTVSSVFARAQYNLLAFSERRTLYFTPDDFAIVRGVIEVEPRLNPHLALTIKGEIPFVLTERRFGGGLTAGIRLLPAGRARGDIVYFQHQVPGGSATWSGNGVRANVAVSF